MTEPWVDVALARLPDTRSCPDCGALLASSRCGSCGIDLSGPLAFEVAAASRAAFDALRARRAALVALRATVPDAAARVPRTAPAPPSVLAPSSGPVLSPGPVLPLGPAVPPQVRRPVAPVPPTASWPMPAGGPPARPTSTVALQPILAGAGAGLLAVAAVVFVFFTFADALALRALVTGLVTLATVAAVVVLRRSGLRSSAEAVAALAVVLALVDGGLALQAGLFSGLDPALAWAVVLALVTGVLGVLGDRARVRVWVTGALVLVPIVPLVAAFAARTPAPYVLALLASALVTLVGAPVARRTGARLDRSLRGDRRYLAVVRTAVVPAAVTGALVAGFWWPAQSLPGWAVAAPLVLAAAVVSAVLRLATHERRWLALLGITAVLAVGLVGAGLPGATDVVPAAAALGWLVLVAGSGPRPTAALRSGRPLADRSRSGLLLGGWITVVVLATPAVLAVPLRATGTVATDAAAGLGVLALAVTSGVAARLPLRVPARPATDVRPVTGLRPAPELRPATGLRGEARGEPVAAVVRAGRAVVGWVTLLVVLAAALDARLLPVTSFVLLALLAAVLVVLLARPAGPADAEGHLVRSLQCTVVRLAGPAARVTARVAGTLRRAGATAQAPAERTRWRTVALTGVFTATALAAAVSWDAHRTTTAGGVVVAALLLGARAGVPRAVRPWLVATADAYALAVLAASLGWAGLPGVAVLCTTSAVASLVALAATVLRRLDRDSWWAVLAVTAVPFTLGVASVVVERSWWSVGACAAMLALELTLVGTRRAGAHPALRALAAGLVLPTASVGVVSAGAVLLVGSGSPVVLPVVAVLVAAVAVGARPAGNALAARGAGSATRIALEASAALTAVIAVGLAYGRPAAGPDVAVAVLVVLAAGAGLLARERDRAWAWWLCAALATGATWTALADAGVLLVEAYTVPPAVAALVVGVLRSRRSVRGWDLAGAGAVLLVAPSLLVLVAAPAAGDVRAPVLVAAAAVAVLAAAALLRWRPGGGTLARAGARRIAASGLVAALAGAVEAVHVGHVPGGGAVFVLGTTWALAGGAVALGAGTVAVGAARVVRRGVVRRWALAPALAVVVVGVVANVRPVWGVIAAAWVLEVLLLALVVVGVQRTLRGREDVPPTWFTWGLALVAAIGAWSPRELRVEVFSLPLGAALVLAGYLALTASTRAAEIDPSVARSTPGGSISSARVELARRWPVGFAGSWRTLAPGILAMLGPSVLATYTDAQTWRAVLVVVLALVAVLVGTREHVAAPFVLGVAVLPVEVLVVFVSQLGTAISAGPWMLTLAAAGGLLLIVATYTERRISASGGAAAYLRDLR